MTGKGTIAFGALAGALFLWTGYALGDVDTYYPYPMYEEYWKDAVPDERPKNGALPPAAAPPAAREPVPWQKVPGFLFPPELGFGVAVGVPDDLFYLSGTYYRVQQGRWYRSGSWRGPWQPVARGKVPKVLLEHDLPAIRKLRNKEFRAYFEQGAKYQGRHFRPVRESGGKVNGVKRPD